MQTITRRGFATALYLSGWLPGSALAATLAAATAASPRIASGAAPQADARAPLERTPARATASSPEARRLHALFDARWEAQMRADPEWATRTGDHRYGDRLTDMSPAAIAASYRATRDTLAQAHRIRRAALSPVDRTSLDIFIQQLQEELRFEPFVGYRSMSLGATGGFQSDFADLLEACPAGSPREAEQVLARLKAYPGRVEQELSRLREGMALGWVPPRTVLERVLSQLDQQLAAEPAKSPYFEPFTRLGADIPAAQRAKFQAEGRRVVEEQIAPALRRLRDFVGGPYLAAAASDGAFAHYPGGAAVYAAQMQASTTTTLTAAQIHAIGVREMARIRGEMDAVISALKFEGGFAAFIQSINSEPRFFVASPEALLAGYRDIAKRIDPELPKLFAELPRLPYGVRAMPAFFSADTAEFYNGPALDGSRPGWFNANVQAWRKRPIWGMETLVAHEAVPGHHLQVARAVELGELPRFRRDAGYDVYAEGWAVYAETLGFELGLYRDPYSRFGHLQWQAFRAGRLVVDTGLHALGWSRQRAIDYMIERTGEDPDYIAAEIDRYLSTPGQALAYTIGALKITELRDRAKARLGARFDIRRFHNVVLDQGAVPLPLLERAVDEWLAQPGAGGAARS